MDNWDFTGALSCSRAEFDGLVAGVDAQWKQVVEDYQLGMVRIEVMEQSIKSIQKYVYAALSGFRLNPDKNDQQLRYRCAGDESFESLLADHAAWQDGLSLDESPRAEWLFACSGEQDGKPAYASASPDQKARLLVLCDACAFSLRRFAHAFDGVEAPQLSGHCYGLGCLHTIEENFSDDGGFLHDPNPIGKTFRIRSESGTDGEITVYGTGYYRGPDCLYYETKGYITGYADSKRDVVGKIELFGHGTNQLDVMYWRSTSVDQPQEFLPETHERWRPYYEELAKLDAWVGEDEARLVQNRLRDLGLTESMRELSATPAPVNISTCGLGAGEVAVEEMLVDAIAEMQRRRCFVRPLVLREQLVRVEGEGQGEAAFACLPLDILDGAISQDGNIDVAAHCDQRQEKAIIELRTSRKFAPRTDSYDLFCKIFDVEFLYAPVRTFGPISFGEFSLGMDLHGSLDWDTLYRSALVLSAMGEYIEAVCSERREEARIVEIFEEFGITGDWVGAVESSVRCYKPEKQAICNIFLPANLALLSKYGLLDLVLEVAEKDTSGGWALFFEYMVYADVIAEALASDLDLTPTQVGTVLWSDYEVFGGRYAPDEIEELRVKFKESDFRGTDAEAWANYSTASIGCILEDCL